MPVESEQIYIINIQLLKSTGLYHLMDPNVLKLFGYNVFKLGSSLLLLCVSLAILMCCISIYYSQNDFNEIIKFIAIIIPTSHALINLCFVIRNSDVLWEFISFTSIHFLSYSGHQKNVLTNARV